MRHTVEFLKKGIHELETFLQSSQISEEGREHALRDLEDYRKELLDAQNIESYKHKAEKYDKIDAYLEKAYEEDENGEFKDPDMDLCVIGEFITTEMGYL